MATLIAANYQSHASTVYGFMHTYGIKLKNSTVYTLKCRYKWNKNGSQSSSPYACYFYEQNWSYGNNDFAFNYAPEDYKTYLYKFTSSSDASNYTYSISNYANGQKSNGVADGAILDVDWYELWEGDATQFTLTEAISISETPNAKTLIDIQNGCTNTNYFSSLSPMNQLASWIGYYYYTGTNISVTSSIQEFEYTGGDATITYTVTKNASNGKAEKIAGVTPLIKTTAGAISNITATNGDGVGTCKLSVGYTNDARDIVLTAIIDGSSSSVNMSQESRDVLTAVSIKSLTVNGGSISVPTYYSAAGASKNISSTSLPTCDILLELTWQGDFGTYKTETPSYATYGTLTGPVYSWSKNNSYTSLTSSNSPTISVTMAGRGQTEGDTRYDTITRNVSYTFTLNSEHGSGSKSGSSSCNCQIQQEANVKTCTGGEISYGAVTKGSINNATISAAGGSATSTASNGTQACTVGRTVCRFTSGQEQITEAHSDTRVVSPSPSSLTASADSRGCNIASKSTVKSTTVTWTGLGGYSASDTMYVYHAENVKTGTSSTTYGNITNVSNKSAYISAGGGSATAYANTGYQVVTPGGDVYSSGCTTADPAYTISVAPSVSSCTASAGSLGCDYIYNATLIKSCPVSYSSNGKTASCTLYVYQNINDYTISYEDEQCDTEWTHSASVSGVSADDLPCSGGESCPYGYSYSATAYWVDTCVNKEIWTFDSGCSFSIDGDEYTEDGSVDMTRYADVSEDCVTAGENSSTSRTYVGDVTVTVTYNEASDSDSASVYQDGCEPDIEEVWGDWHFGDDVGFETTDGDYLYCNECTEVTWYGGTSCSRSSNLGNYENGTASIDTGSVCYSSRSQAGDRETFYAIMPDGSIYDSITIVCDSAWTC